MTLAAADRVVELTAHFERVRAAAATRCAAEGNRLGPLGGIGEEGGERLEVREHVAPLPIRETGLPPRHRGPAQPFIYRAEQIGVRRQLAARRRPNLVDGAREVARRRDD